MKAVRADGTRTDEAYTTPAHLDGRDGRRGRAPFGPREAQGRRRGTRSPAGRERRAGPELSNFRWLITKDGIEVVQPDSYYFGGLIRCVKVGRMTAAFGKSIVPHMSGGELGSPYNLRLVSVLPNAGAHLEFKGLDTQVRFECKTSPLKVVTGKIKAPTGPGLGVEIDPGFIRKHDPLKV